MFCDKGFTENVSATGKVVVVTGANAGIGFQTAKELNLRGAKVYMLCRSELRANLAKKKLTEEGCDASRLIFLACDLSKFASIRQCAEKLTEAESTIDILVNNAGIMFYPKYELTEDGHEMTWQSNHLGPFLLTELLLPLVERAAEGRIVMLSSDLHEQSGPIDLSTIDDEKSYGRFAPYNRVMHTRELARLLKQRGSRVTVNAVHPGVVATDLSKNMPLVSVTKPIMKLFMKTEKEGAQTSLYVALSTAMKGQSGGYYADCKLKAEHRDARDDEACKRLYEYSKKAVGLD